MSDFKEMVFTKPDNPNSIEVAVQPSDEELGIDAEDETSVDNSVWEEVKRETISKPKSKKKKADEEEEEEDEKKYQYYWRLRNPTSINDEATVVAELDSTQIPKEDLYVKLKSVVTKSLSIKGEHYADIFMSKSLIDKWSGFPGNIPDTVPINGQWEADKRQRHYLYLSEQDWAERGVFSFRDGDGFPQVIHVKAKGGSADSWNERRKKAIASIETDRGHLRYINPNIHLYLVPTSSSNQQNLTDNVIDTLIKLNMNKSQIEIETKFSDWNPALLTENADAVCKQHIHLISKSTLAKEDLVLVCTAGL
jgi:hypothetical protein